MRRSPANSTHRSLAAFGKLQHIRIISPRVLRAVLSSRAVCCVCLLDQSVAAVGVQEYLSFSLAKYVRSTRVRRIRVRPSPA